MDYDETDDVGDNDEERLYNWALHDARGLLVAVLQAADAPTAAARVARVAQEMPLIQSPMMLSLHRGPVSVRWFSDTWFLIEDDIQ